MTAPKTRILRGGKSRDNQDEEAVLGHVPLNAHVLWRSEGLMPHSQMLRVEFYSRRYRSYSEHEMIERFDSQFRTHTDYVFVRKCRSKGSRSYIAATFYTEITPGIRVLY